MSKKVMNVELRIYVMLLLFSLERYDTQDYENIYALLQNSPFYQMNCIIC